MNNWLCSLNGKKYQRRMNRAVRRINKLVKEDEKWQGRFTMQQIDSPHFHIYNDRSGGEYFVRFELRDNVTGVIGETGYDDVNSWCSFNEWKLWQLMNKFICDITCNFQFSNSGPNISYRKVVEW